MVFGEHDKHILLVLDGDVHYQGKGTSMREVCLSALSSSFDHASNWEAVGMLVSTVRRPEKRLLKVYMSEEILYDVKTQIQDLFKSRLIDEIYQGYSLEFNEMSTHNYPDLVSYMTFGRDENANWGVKDAPVERAVVAYPLNKLGDPGGPCHIIRDIQEENLPRDVKQDLIREVQRGVSLRNDAALLLYERRRLPSFVRGFASLVLTAHFQYRMNIRGIKFNTLKDVLKDFDAWLRDQDSREVRSLLSDLSQGHTAKFDSTRHGISLIVASDSSNKNLKLVSIWNMYGSNRIKPRPGECERTIPFYPLVNASNRKAATMNRLSSILAQIDASIDTMERKARMRGEMYLIPRDHDEEDRFLDAYYRGEEPLSDPSSWYEDSYEDYEQELWGPTQPLPGSDDDVIMSEEGEVDAGGNRYYRGRPVSPQNRKKNRERRKKYRRDPSYRRKKKRQEKKYRKKPRTKRLRKRQRQRRKQRGR